MKNDNDSAIAEVFGVLLLVLIVTVLAACTALGVYIYLQDLRQPTLAELTINRLNPSTVRIMYKASFNIKEFNTSVTCPFVVYVDNVETSPIPPTQLTKDLGSYADYHANPGQNVTIIALFEGNRQQIIYTNKV